MRLRCLVLIVILTALPAVVHARQSARDYFEPLVSHHQFTTLVRNLDLAREQRMIVEAVFMDYLDAIDRLAREADAAADEVGRRTVLDALSGRAIVDPAELRRLRLAVLDVYESYLNQVDREFEKLTLGVRSVLTDVQRPIVDANLRSLRRAVLLHPRHTERNFHEYAGDGVDVLLLLEEAFGEGEEFANLDRREIESIIEQYERDLDRLLVETAHQYRLARMQLRKARISRDSADLREAERSALAVWQRFFSLNSTTVERIGEAAAARLGAEAQERWLARFDKASFAWMFASQSPDRQYEWLMRQSLTDTQRENIQRIYDDYLARRAALASFAIDTMIRARLDFQIIVHSMMDPRGLSGQARRLYDQLVRNSGEIASLDSRTSDAFEDQLDRHQRTAFRNATRRR